LFSRRGRSLPANASGLDTHRDSITSRFDCSTSQDVDAALRRTLRVRFELGLFDSKSSNPTQAKLTSLDASAVGTAASAALSLDAARQSIVLLRNDGAADGGVGVLPFGSSAASAAASAAGHASIRRIAVIGALANATLPLMGTHYRGYACGNANKDDLSCVPTVGEAFAAALGPAGVAVEIVPGSEIDSVIPGGVAAAGIS
jgi:beta-glucosidase-like glycosyl hydrolase